MSWMPRRRCRRPFSGHPAHDCPLLPCCSSDRPFCRAPSMAGDSLFSRQRASNIVVLNVGGRLFTTTLTTLTTFPDSMLAGMCRGDMPAGHSFRGGIFIDRDPTHFSTILTFLRDGHVPLPEATLERQQLRAEAAFYSLTELVAAIDDAEAARAEEAAAERARQAEAAQAAHYVASHRAELLRAASEAVGRAEAVLRQLRASQEAGRGALRRVEERARRLQGALVAPGQPNEAAQELQQLEGEAARLRTVLEETAVQLRSAERRLDNMRLARICAAGHDVQAAQVLLAALHPA
ncbi:hypothetical protein ABPG77_006913 [Micractinium sp. CCAP 211/92]